MDLWGPYKTKTLLGASYFLTILDDHSRCTWTYLIQNKMQVFKVIESFFAMVNTQFHTQIKCIRSDNGTEIIQDQCTSFFLSKGVLHQKSLAGVPQQNGRVERKHKHLLEVARALKFHAHMPTKFWGDCILTATFLINHLPSSVLNWTAPFEILYKQSPDYSMLKVFGCLCYAHTRTKDKFMPRAARCVFLGYSFGQKGYKVYDLTTHKCFVTRDVLFKEDIFPFKPTSTAIPSPHTSTTTSLISLHDSDHVSSHTSDPITPPTSSLLRPQSTATHLSPLLHSSLIFASNSSESSLPHHNSTQHNSVIQPDSIPTSSTQHNSIHNSPDINPDPSSTIHITSVPSSSISVPPPRHSTRIVKPPTKFNDFICPTLPNSTSSFSFFANIHSAKVEPSTYYQASVFPEWQVAMQKELDALEANNTWELQKLPHGKKAIGSKWVFKIKYNPDGTVERYKARLVATGYQQVEGKDFTHTFSPVAKIATVRIIISLATAKHWPLCQLDINNAFLHGYLDEEVFMKPPLSYKKAGVDDVCRLKRSLYGLKQASRQWNKELSKFLLGLGFVQSKQDYSLFTRTLDGEFIIILVYVDDMVLTGTNQSQIDQIKRALDQAFTIKDLGEMKYFLGIEVIRDASGTVLSQRKYISDIIKDLKLDSSKPVSSPLPKGLGLSTDLGECLDDPEIYRRLIGRLLYLNITRPDISYATQHLSQFLSCPRKPHLQAAMYVVRYLKHTINMGLFYSSSCDLSLTAYSDADWSSCLFSSRSLSAYCIFLGNHLVSWKTKKQRTVSKSSAEAEYRSMSSTASEIVWVEGLLQDLYVPVKLPIFMYCDNQAAQHIAQNPVFHERTKHLKRDCHYVREQVEAGFLQTVHVNSSSQLFDLLTKPLPGPQHHILASKLGLVNCSTSPA